jgi:hypothetical protein
MEPMYNIGPQGVPELGVTLLLVIVAVGLIGLVVMGLM